MTDFLHSPATAQTLDAPASLTSASPAEPCRKVAFVEGSCPKLSAETTQLRRARLHAAATCLSLAAAAFLVWRMFVSQQEWSAERSTVVHYLHTVATGLLIGCFVMLRRRQPIGCKALGVYEAIIFGAPAVVLLALQYESMHFCAHNKNYIPNPVGAWLALLFTYALFIPNTWRRAAVVIGAMAAAPLVLMLVMGILHEKAATLLLRDPDFVVQSALMMALGFTTSVYGTHAIGCLREQAYAAKQLGQYRLVRPIGAGGMGEVYLAEHEMMKRPCAIKIIRPGNQNDPRAIARFEREVRATARLSHWNTIEIFDYGRTEDGTFYYVMEYLPGMNLGELVERFGPLPPERVVHLLAQTCDALGEAHAAGLIHRDIKPGNIFAAQRGGVYDVAKLLDFGLAKPIIAHGSAQLTQDGFITGSPLYMSPEQAADESEPDGRSDIYSLGAVAYYLLTGAAPFEGDKPLKVIMAHANQPVVPPSQVRSEVPRDVELVVMRCLAKRPEDRFQDAASLADALRACSVAGRWGRDHAARWWQSRAAIEPCTAEAVAVA